MVVTRDGRYGLLFWAAGSPDGSVGPAYVEKWRLDRGGPSQLVRLGGNDMVAAGALPGDKLIVATDETISTWNAKTMKEIHSVPTPRGAAGAVAAYSPDGRFFAWGLEDGTVHFFDLQTGNIADSLGGHAAGVVQIAFFLPDGRVAESGGDDGLSILWDPVTGQPLARLSGHGSARVLGADFSADGKTLYTASLDGTVFQWDLTEQHRFGKGVQNGLSAAARAGRDWPRRDTTCDFAGRLALCNATRRLLRRDLLDDEYATSRDATGLGAGGRRGLVFARNAGGHRRRWPGSAVGCSRRAAARQETRRTQVDQRTARDGD